MYPNVYKLILIFATICICSISVTDNAFVSSAVYPTSAPSTPVKLIFIHHSCGENWLSDSDGGLGIALKNNNYFVSDTNYCWGTNSIGSRTNTEDWAEWFLGPNSGTYMSELYSESNQHSTYSRLATNPGGENEIIMFKSCYPCSNVGDSIDDEKTKYNNLKSYFAAHPDKLFVLITPPGTIDVPSYQKTRELCNWLVDKNGWLSGYTQKNVFVYDFYGTLSETGSHHRWAVDHVEHIYASNYDGTSPYHSGDDHPNAAGNQKATSEFVPLLNYAYHLWKNDALLNPPSITASPKAGKYYSPISVTLTPKIPATIYYTTNGVTPTTYSTKYTGPIKLTHTTTLKYRGVSTSDGSSSIYTAKYAIYKKVKYKAKIKVKYKRSKNKHWRKVKVKYKSHGKWKVKKVWKKVYLYKYRYVSKWRTKWVLT